ncbi:MAG: hypothetical protein ABW208_14020 [Pyrinomonadaceae bacterium]
MSKRVFDPAVDAPAAGARRRSEGVTLACAVLVAVTLGGVFGVWINVRMTPTPSAGAPRPSLLLPDARASAPPAPPATTVLPSPCDGCETSPVGEATPARAPADKSGEADEVRPGTDSLAPAGAAHAAVPDAAAAVPTRTDEIANAIAEPHGATASEVVAAPTPDPSRPVAWEVSPLPKAGGRAAARVNVERGAAQVGERPAAGGAQPPPGPCVPYASASSLGVRVGGAAPLILGGPGVGVRINVSTPDRSELAVIYEGPASGDKGWLRYSVRSVGRRPGLYTVRFSTPCGSQTIPVTVK